VKDEDFDTKSTAPRLSALIVVSVPRWVWPLTMIMIGFGGGAGRICFMGGQPVEFRHPTSMVMMSGLRSRASATACARCAPRRRR
jgi:hypothetical protein